MDGEALGRVSDIAHRQVAGAANLAARLRRHPGIAWALAVLLMGASVYWGMQLRRWVWDRTVDIHLVYSLSNAIDWGEHAHKVGVFQVYDDLYTRFGPDGDYIGGGRIALDYPPLRLLIMYWWRNWAYSHFPPDAGDSVSWQPQYEFTAPMMWLNTACELVAMLGMFLLVYRWMRICALPAPARWWTLRPSAGWGRDEQLERMRDLPSILGLRQATFAALLIWFNPAVIFNAHGYPQWDVWVLPAVIWGAFLAMGNRWLPAGLVIGVLAMAKGQILFTLPLFIAWPLLLGNVSGAVRMTAGVAAGIGLVIWPWMMRSAAAQSWMVYVGVSGALIITAGLLPRKGLGWWIARGTLALVAIGVLCVPALGQWALVYVVLLGVIVGLGALIGNRWWTLTSLCILWAGSLAITVPLCNASMAWYEVGIRYGTRHWKRLYWGLAPNLGSILQSRMGWGYTDVVDIPRLAWAGLSQVSIRHVMITLCVVALAICIVGFVRHRRNHDPRLLVALATPLMLSYALLPQMIERYLMWPAALLSAYAAISVGGFVLWVPLSAAGCLMMFAFMLTMARQAQVAQDWSPTMHSFFPDIAWAVFVIAAVMLYLSIRSTPGRATKMQAAQSQSASDRADLSATDAGASQTGAVPESTVTSGP